MIDCLLPAAICQTREKIRRLAVCLRENRGRVPSPFCPGASEKETGKLLRQLEFQSESFRPGDRKSVNLLWLVEELAAAFPETALKVVVWIALIAPVVKESGLGQNLPEIPFYNHLFLPPPARKALKLLEAGLAGSTATGNDSGEYFLAFDLPSVERILAPVASQVENPSDLRVVYYLVMNKNPDPGCRPIERRCFPFRPLRYWRGEEGASSQDKEPLLTLTGSQFQARLETYFLLRRWPFFQDGPGSDGRGLSLERKVEISGRTRARKYLSWQLKSVGSSSDFSM